MEIVTRELTHYARHKTVTGFYAEPTSTNEVAELIHTARQRSLRVCVMGAQNSFSDIFLAEGQLHISLMRMNQILHVNQHTGEIVAQPGVRIWQLLQVLLPYGWYLTGISGSYTDTIGGMISSNSHGKDSWKKGNCGNNVSALKLLTADGTIQCAERNTPLMNAVIGGLGMLGVVVELKLQATKLPSFTMRCRDAVISTSGISAFQSDADYKYAVVDMANRGKPLTIVKTANFDSTMPPQQIVVPEAKPTVWGMHSAVFWKILRVFWNPYTYAYFNATIRAAHQQNKTDYQSTLLNYCYPWRKYPDNFRVLSGNSFREVQALFSYENFQEAVRRVTELTRQFGIFPINVNVKWHQPESFYLSFSGQGLCLLTTFDSSLLDNSNGKKFLEAYMQLIDLLKGKVYLSKYSYMTSEQVRKQYPRFDNWINVKSQADPGNMFTSDRAKTLLGL